MLNDERSDIIIVCWQYNEDTGVIVHVDKLIIAIISSSSAYTIIKVLSVNGNFLGTRMIKIKIKIHEFTMNERIVPSMGLFTFSSASHEPLEQFQLNFKQTILE